ncbi:Stp1/IreP family PP2C-type Ser/Thr phosphatase [Aliikangiella sp. IMCC44632]
MKYSIASLCKTGNFRKNNEDALGFQVQTDFVWAVIADGMGGHQAGDVASQLFVQQVDSAMGGIANPQTTHWSAFLVELCEQANQVIWEESTANSHQAGMGTTGVIAVIFQDKLYTAWIGDSRAYLLHAGQLSLLTRDHSALHYLLDKGAITKKQAEKSDTKHLLAKAVGIKEKVQPEVIVTQLNPHDQVILSSDGLHDFVTKETLESILNNSSRSDTCCEKLYQAALAGGSKDNISCLIITPHE